MAVYIPGDRVQAGALNKAAKRGVLRRIAQRVYTDDLTSPPERIIDRHLLAIIGSVYPDWHLSYTTAALLRAHEGAAFISGPAASRHETALPGVTIRRMAALPHPDLTSLTLDDEVHRTPTGPPERVEVQLSSPLQTVFELLRRDRRAPERTLPDAQVRALVGALPAAERGRAESFAQRNGLHHEWRRFAALEEGLQKERAVVLPRASGVDVFFYHYRVGRLEELVHGEYRFTYDPAWKIPLSGLPHSPQGPAYEGRTLPPFFDNLLPEGWTEARLRAVHKISREDPFALLRTTPKYLSNMTLRPRDMDPSEITLDVLEERLADLKIAARGAIPVSEQIGDDPDTRELWMELKRRGATRLSGVQPKLPVRLHVNAGGVRLSLGGMHNTSTHILKLASREYPELIQNEWATMELARRGGLDVAAVCQVAFQEGSRLASPALLIERFDLPDRLERTDLPLMEEASSLLGIARKDKYDVSMERIAAALAGAGLSDADLERFFDHVVFSWLAGNGDLHAKNVAVLHQIRPGSLGLPPVKTGTVYSPLYDLVNTRAVLVDDLFALPVNGKQNNLRAKDFAVLARRFGWYGRRARDRFDRVAAAMEEHLAPVLAASGLSEAAQERFQRIVHRNLGSHRGTEAQR